MLHRRGTAANNTGSNRLNVATAFLRATCTAPWDEFGLIGTMSDTASSLASTVAISRSQRSPLRRPNTLINATAPTRSKTSSALGSGISSGPDAGSDANTIRNSPMAEVRHRQNLITQNTFGQAVLSMFHGPHIHRLLQPLSGVVGWSLPQSCPAAAVTICCDALNAGPTP
jgi:hypothetical protein